MGFAEIHSKKEGEHHMSAISSETQNRSVEEIAQNLSAAGIPPEFGADNSRLLVKSLRTLAKGQPITNSGVERISDELGMAYGQADEFLQQVTERDSNDNIIGLVGLSLNQEWPHRFHVNGNSLRTWCAWDALFLPPLLGEEVVVESESPVSGKTVLLRVNPDAVANSMPEGAVVSIATIEPKVHDVSSVEAIWGNFCHQVYFFPSREEADEWAAGKSNIAILTVEEAHELGRLAFHELLAYA